MASSKIAKEIMELGPEAFNSFKKLLGMGVKPEQAAGVVKSQSQEVARQARATEGGFNTKEVWYHGTADNITEFDPTKLGSRDHGFLGKGVYITPNEGVAKAYSKTAKGSSKPQVLQLHTSANNPFQITLEQKNMLQKGGPKEAERFQQWVLDNGYDSAEVVTPSGEILERVVYNPTQLRAPNAQFKDLKSGKLLAGATGAAVLGGQTEDAEAGILNVKGFADEVGRLIEVGFLNPKNKADPKKIQDAADRYNKTLKTSRGFGQREDLAAMNDAVTKRTINTYKDQAKVYSPEELADMGAVIMPVKGDQSFIGEIQQVSGIPLANPVKEQGGFQYPFANEEGWQSMTDIAQRFIDKARRVSETNNGAPVAAAFSQMGRESINFSSPPSAVILDQVNNFLDIDPQVVKQFDAEMKNKYPSWVGIKSPEALDWLNGHGAFHNAEHTGKRRTFFSKLTSKAGYRDQGFPLYSSIIDQLNHPLLANKPDGTTGASLFFPDLNRDAWTDPTIHDSYWGIIPQDQSKPAGRLATPVDFQDVFPDGWEETASMMTKPKISKKTGELTKARPYTDLERRNTIADSSLGKTPATGGFQNTTEEWVKGLNNAFTKKGLLGLSGAGGVSLLLPTEQAQAAGLSGSIEAPTNPKTAELYNLVNQMNNKLGDEGLGMLLQRKGIEDYLRKLAYGDDISYIDRLFASLDLAP